jgi:hypothetical protein
MFLESWGYKKAGHGNGPLYMYVHMYADDTVTFSQYPLIKIPLPPFF